MNTKTVFHAHIYYDADTNEKNLAKDIWLMFETGQIKVDYLGKMHDKVVGPHPKAQFEVHFQEKDLWKIAETLYQVKGTLSILLHPVSPNDHEDHFQDAIWIGEPQVLDSSKLDPPGKNKAFERLFKKSFD